MKKLTRDEMAKRVALDIQEGAYVNLGIGVPTLVANHLATDREIFLHSENGLLGMGPAPEKGAEDDELINAGKQHVTLLTGGAYFHHADSFAMMRGGHLDICVLGAFQVSAKGDRWGNLVYRKTARNFGPIMASAAKTAIVQVSQVVPLGELDPENIVTPGIFVQRVVEVPQAVHAAELAAQKAA